MQKYEKRIRIETNVFSDMMDIIDKIKEEGKVLRDYYYRVDYPGRDIIITLEFTEEKYE